MKQPAMSHVYHNHIVAGVFEYFSGIGVIFGNSAHIILVDFFANFRESGAHRDCFRIHEFPEVTCNKRNGPIIHKGSTHRPTMGYLN